jgi:hypothetical protein
MITKIKLALLVGSLISTIGLAAPAVAATTLVASAKASQGQTIDGYPAQEWQQDAPSAFVGGA